MTTEVTVKRKGQITIPAKVRKKLGIEEDSKLELEEQDDAIVLRKRVSIFDLAGVDAGEASVDEIKKELDQMRAQDA